MSATFELASWYPSETAKRGLGRICQAVNEEGASVTLLGTETEPLLILVDADELPADTDDIEMSIDEAKADWSAVTTAAAVYGTRFRIKGKKRMRAVLRRHPAARHPAERYLRSSSADANRLADQLESLATQVRKLGDKLARLIELLPSSDLNKVAERLDRSASIIDRRFAEIWRSSNGHVAAPA